MIEAGLTCGVEPPAAPVFGSASGTESNGSAHQRRNGAQGRADITEAGAATLSSWGALWRPWRVAVAGPVASRPPQEALARVFAGRGPQARTSRPGAGMSSRLCLEVGGAILGEALDQARQEISHEPTMHVTTVNE